MSKQVTIILGLSWRRVLGHDSELSALQRTTYVTEPQQSGETNEIYTKLSVHNSCTTERTR
jgi:hypothetical protein